jgi:hypothetical protein
MGLQKLSITEKTNLKKMCKLRHRKFALAEEKNRVFKTE